MSKTNGNPAFFTLITVTLNNLAGLKNTNTSVQNQSFKDFEWIVIDGGSTDGTPEYLKTTTAKWTSGPDLGLYDAMNKGIERATGTYLLFLNAGDMLAEADTLEKLQTAAQTQNTPAFLYGDSFEQCPNAQAAYKPARLIDLKMGMFTHHQAMLYNRQALGNLRYDLNYQIAADYDFTARFLNGKDESDILYCAFPICIFESGGISQTKAALGRHEQRQIRKTLKLAKPLQNWVITTAQAALWRLRLLAPSLYWYLKSSDNTAPANAQNDTPPAHPKPPAAPHSNE